MPIKTQPSPSNEYVQGSIIIVDLILTDDDPTSSTYTQQIDPTTLEWELVAPDGTVTVYTYGVGSTITRVAKGEYRTLVDTTSQAKWWRGTWRSTGAGQGVALWAAYIIAAVPL